MLGQVDVEGDGGVEDGQEVGHLAHLVDPDRPGNIILRQKKHYFNKKVLLLLPHHSLSEQTPRHSGSSG